MGRAKQMGEKAQRKNSVRRKTGEEQQQGGGPFPLQARFSWSAIFSPLGASTGLMEAAFVLLSHPSFYLLTCPVTQRISPHSTTSRCLLVTPSPR